MYANTAELNLATEPLRRQADAALTAYLGSLDGVPDELLGAMRYSLLAPGKRLRPMLALLASEACGGDRAAAMPAACAVEMIHAYSLIHDDLPAMDDDDLRRGQPSCHKKFDEAVAILAGDALLTLAFEVLANDVRPPRVAAACCAALAQAAGACQLVGGQADDIAGPTDEGTLSQTESLESIHRRKTGAIIRVSLQLGGMTADANDEQLGALDCYGEKLGLAFQITDDLLDVRGEEGAVGKRLGKDARQGKLTFPGLLGIETSLDRVERLIDEACEAIVVLGDRRDSLETLARYVQGRNR